MTTFLNTSTATAKFYSPKSSVCLSKTGQYVVPKPRYKSACWPHCPRLTASSRCERKRRQRSARAFPIHRRLCPIKPLKFVHQFGHYDSCERQHDCQQNWPHNSPHIAGSGEHHDTIDHQTCFEPCKAPLKSVQKARATVFKVSPQCKDIPWKRATYPALSIAGQRLTCRSGGEHRRPKSSTRSSKGASQKSRQGFSSPKSNQNIIGDDQMTNDQDGGSDPPSPNPGGPQGIGDKPLDLFACPYAKQNPVKYLKCVVKEFSTVGQVKQHLYRAHTDHNSSDPAYERGSIPVEGQMTANQTAEVKRRWRGKGGRRSWFKIWTTLFPHIPKPKTPYVSPVTATQCFAEIIQVVGLQTFLHVIRDCRDRLTGPTQSFIDEAFIVAQSEVEHQYTDGAESTLCDQPGCFIDDDNSTYAVNHASQDCSPGSDDQVNDHLPELSNDSDLSLDLAETDFLSDSMNTDNRPDPINEFTTLGDGMESDDEG